MKKLYLFITLLLSLVSNSQIINFPDPVFKAKLLSSGGGINAVAANQSGMNLTLDSNGDGNIEVSEVQNVYSLYLDSSNISDLTGIENFTTVRRLFCSMNQLTSVNLTALTNLETVYINNNQLTTLNLSSQPNIKRIQVNNNQLTQLNTNNLAVIEMLKCSNNQLGTLLVNSFVQSPSIAELNCSFNALTSLVIHNGNFSILNCNNNQLQSLSFTGDIGITELMANNNQLATIDLSTLNSDHFNTIELNFNQLSQIILPNDLGSQLQLLLNYNQFTEFNLNAIIANGLQLQLNQNLLTSFHCELQGKIQFVDVRENPLEHFYLNATNTNEDQQGIVDVDDVISDFQILARVRELWISNAPNPVVDFSHVNASNIGMPMQDVKQIYLKNGNQNNIYFSEAPLLEYVCADDSDLESLMQTLNDNGLMDVVVNGYCSFTPGGEFYEIAGSTTFDANNDGCDGSDPKMPFSKYAVTDGSITEYITASGNGNYSIPVLVGTHTLIPVIENPSYFNISPASVNITVPTDLNPLTQQFCLTPNGTHSDLEVTVLPLTANSPGFDTRYKIIYKNKGNMALSANVTFNFDHRTEYVSASVAPSALSATTAVWNVTNMNPFEKSEIVVVLNNNSPMETPAVNGGDILHHSASGALVTATDETPNDNIQYINSIVVNSFDPNDKVCSEGTVVGQQSIGKYVHYTIHFENTGTANAHNIVVKDDIDPTKFDISSLIALDGSHNFYTRINGNKVEFIFENINLPFNDANNDGYVAFKIKTKPTLSVGDSFSNSASIYFDYNHPIVTEPAVTTISVLKSKDFELSDFFTVYPNPANDVLNIQSKNNIEITSAEIYNTLGQLVIAVTNSKEVSNIDVSNLTPGNYFIRIHSDKGTTNTKFAKK